MMPISQQAPIVGNVRYDTEQRDRQLADAKNPLLICYPGGQDRDNLQVFVGDFVFGMRNSRDPDTLLGAGNELALSSISGQFVQEGSSLRELQDTFYPIGVATTPKDTLLGGGPNFGVLRSGTITVENDGGHIFYPGDLVCVEWPTVAETNKWGGLQPGARAGERPERVHPVYRPFHRADFRLYYDAAYSLADRSRMDGGIADIPLYEFLGNEMSGFNPKVSTQQEEAGGHIYGSLSVALGMIEFLIAVGALNVGQPGSGVLGVPVRERVEEGVRATAQLASDYDLLSTTPTGAKNRTALFAHAFYRDIVAMPNVRDPSSAVESSGVPAEYKFLRANASRFHSGAALGNLTHKMQWVVARALNFAAPSDSLDLALNITH
jgi:hypothetical protein